mgnify:CR=1 FL=1
MEVIHIQSKYGEEDIEITDPEDVSCLASPPLHSYTLPAAWLQALKTPLPSALSGRQQSVPLSRPGLRSDVTDPEEIAECMKYLVYGELANAMPFQKGYSFSGVVVFRIDDYGDNSAFYILPDGKVLPTNPSFHKYHRYIADIRFYHSSQLQ